MVRRVLQFLHKEVSGLHEAAYLLALFALLSQVLALVRDRLFAGYFGAGQTLDLYYAAFRIPDIILVSAASIVSVSILIPFLIEKLEANKIEARQFVDGIFTVFFAGIVILSAIVFLFVPQILPIIFPGFTDTGSMDQLIVLTRIMLLQPILLGLSNLFASITQVYKKFFVYATSPLLYNMGIIIGVVAFYPLWGISGLAWGVVLGAALHFSIQIPVIARVGFLPAFTMRVDWRSLFKVISVSLPRTLALGATNIAALILISLASLMEVGSIAVFNLSWNLQTVPIAIIGTSYSVASFPLLSRLFTRGDNKEFFTHVTNAARHIIFWSFPALVLFIVLRAQIVRTIFGYGEFGWDATRLVAASLALFAISIVAHSLISLFIRAYYARGNTRTPLMVSLFSAVLIVVLAFVFRHLYETWPVVRFFIEILLRVEGIPGTKVLVLPLAYSLALIAGIVAMWILFKREMKDFSAMVKATLFQSFSASVIMGFVAFLFLNVFDDIFNLNTVFGIFMQGFLSGIIGIGAGIAVLKLLGNREVDEIWQTLHHKFWKAKVIAPDATEDTAL